jgi:hypothetical protein
VAKRRPKNYNRLTKPRKQMKLDMIKRLSEIYVPFVRSTNGT